MKPEDQIRSARCAISTKQNQQLKDATFSLYDMKISDSEEVKIYSLLRQVDEETDVEIWSSSEILQVRFNKPIAEQMSVGKSEDQGGPSTKGMEFSQASLKYQDRSSV